MISEALVSIVIPSYGRPVLVKRAVLSALKQTWKKIEVIVVDDNGLDSDNQKATEAILKEICDNRLRYFALKTNSGASVARNFGAKHSNGDYLAFLDNDDEFLPEKIELQLKKMVSEQANNARIFTSVSHFCYCRSGNVVENPKKPDFQSLALNVLTKKVKLLTGSTLLVEKKAFERLNGFDESFSRHQDIEFLVRLLSISDLSFEPNVLVKIHIDDRSNIKRPKELYQIKRQFFQKFENALKLLTPEQSRNYYQAEYFELARVSIRFLEFSSFLFFIKKSKAGFADLLTFFKESWEKARKSII